MTEKFQKPFIDRPSILNPKPGDPNGYATKDGMWAAVPWGKKFVIIHNGFQVEVCNNYKLAKAYIDKQVKLTKPKRSKTKTGTATLEDHLK
jgi:hypothetical protein